MTAELSRSSLLALPNLPPTCCLRRLKRPRPSLTSVVTFETKHFGHVPQTCSASFACRHNGGIRISNLGTSLPRPRFISYRIRERYAQLSQLFITQSSTGQRTERGRQDEPYPIMAG